MAKDKRVEVLFESAEYKILEDAAHRQGKAVGAVIRDAVAKYVTDSDRKSRIEAMQRLLAIEGGPVGSPEELKEYMARTQYEAIVKGMPGYEDSWDDTDEAH